MGVFDILPAMAKTLDEMAGPVRKARQEAIVAESETSRNISLATAAISDSFNVASCLDADAVKNVESGIEKYYEALAEGKTELAGWLRSRLEKAGVVFNDEPKPKPETPKRHRKKRSRKPKKAANNTKSPIP